MHTREASNVDLKLVEGVAGAKTWEADEEGEGGGEHAWRGIEFLVVDGSCDRVDQPSQATLDQDVIRDLYVKILGYGEDGGGQTGGCRKGEARAVWRGGRRGVECGWTSGGHRSMLTSGQMEMWGAEA